MSPPWMTPIPGSIEMMVAFLMSCLVMTVLLDFTFDRRERLPLHAAAPSARGAVNLGDAGV
jgi:hypothetical protein